MNRLWIKLTLAFLGVALLAAGTVAVLTERATGNEFRQYIVRTSMMSDQVATQSLIDYYAAHRSWDGVDALLDSLNANGQGSMGMGMGHGKRAGMPRYTLADATGIVIVDGTGTLAGRHISDSVLAQGVSLVYEGKPVGTLLSLSSGGIALDEQGQAFLDRVRWSVTWAAALAALLALALGILVSRRMTAPIRRLTEAAGAVASGDLTHRVSAEGGDEIGELGSAFNQMAASLEQAEKLRRDMMADVAHELRTPLTVVQGNLQAMLDGVYPLDATQVATVYDETRLLTRLVEDLRDLALAEAGELRLERKPVDLRVVANSAIAGFAPAADAAGVSLSLDAPSEMAPVLGDEDRLAQVLRNLLSNAIRHTPSGGNVEVSLNQPGGFVELVVSDSGRGIAAEDLPRLFDRFYRGDKSRSRREGGAGLGLAIVKQLVAAHGGTIAVSSGPGRGASFTVRLPQFVPEATL